jgi:hypothetical protein
MATATQAISNMPISASHVAYPNRPDDSTVVSKLYTASSRKITVLFVVGRRLANVLNFALL